MTHMCLNSQFNMEYSLIEPTLHNYRCYMINCNSLINVFKVSKMLYYNKQGICRSYQLIANKIFLQNFHASPPFPDADSILSTLTNALSVTNCILFSFKI